MPSKCQSGFEKVHLGPDNVIRGNLFNVDCEMLKLQHIVCLFNSIEITQKYSYTVKFVASR